MLGKVDRVDLLEDALLAFPVVIVREVRLAPLLEGVVTERLLVAVLATSTVRFTGRARFALLRVERLEDDWDGAGLEGFDWVDDLLDREFEDRDALGVAVAGVDRLFWTDCDARDDLDAVSVDL